MSPSIRYTMGLAGLIGTIICGLIFILFRHVEPFGIVPPVVEAVLIAFAMAPLLYLSISMRSRFDQEGYVRVRGQRGIVADIVRIIVVCAMFGMAVGLLSAFFLESTTVRIGLILLVEYFTAFWVFSMANAEHYDDRHLRKALGRS